MYDFGARMYMPDLGRFAVVDPMADFVNYQSPYIVSDDNPVYVKKTEKNRRNSLVKYLD